MNPTKEELQDTSEVFEAMIQYGERQMECPFEDLLNNLDVGSAFNTIRTFLDNALNPPDLSELKREVWDGMNRDRAVSVRHYEGMCAAIDHLSPRIVRKGCQHEIIDIKNEVIQSGYMCIKCNALFSAAQKGD